MIDTARWGELPRGDRADAASVWPQIDALLANPACAGRPVRYRVERQQPVSRDELAAWIADSAAEGFRTITYAVNPLHAGPVEVSVYATRPPSAESSGTAHT